MHISQFNRRGRLLHPLMRLPLHLYHLHLGWLLGERFLLLSHRGRKSGRIHETALEVIRHDPVTGVYIIASGWGTRADWFRNILQTPQVTVHSGRRHFQAVAHRLDITDAEREITDYGRRHPFAFRKLAGLIVDKPLTNTSADYHYMATAIPFVALIPTQRPD